MIGYIVRRIALGLSVLFTAFTATFALFFFGPADPAAAMCGDRNCTPERYENIKRSLGLDAPKLQQYWEFLTGIFTGRTLQSGGWVKECPAPCFGYSFRENRPVSQIMAENLPPTISIAVGASIIFFTVGVLLGVYAAINRGTLIDKGLVGASLTLSSFPYYILALLASLYLISNWQIFPASGWTPPFGEDGSLFEWFKGLLLAWLVLGIFNSTSYARFTRASMVETLGEDFVRTARAKGLAVNKVNFKHALRAGLAPVITIFGLDLAGLFGGTLFTERIFEIQGIGYTSVEAVRNQDFPIIMGTVMFAALIIVIANLIVDLVYSIVDPRVRLT